MCLDTAYRQESSPIVVGYHVRIKSAGNRYCPAHFRVYGSIGIGVWSQAVQCPTLSTYGDTYTTGFHVFHKLADARQYARRRLSYSNRKVIVKVACKDCICTGSQTITDIAYQHHSQVSVFEQIKIIKEVPMKHHN